MYLKLKKPIVLSFILTGLQFYFGTNTVTAQVISQGAGQRAIVIARDRRIYVVDFTQGTSAKLPFVFDTKSSFSLSPDHSRLAVSGGGGVDIYKFVGASISKIAQVTSEISSGVTWSPDGKSLTYMQETPDAGGGVTVSIFLWDSVTGQTKRLL